MTTIRVVFKKRIAVEFYPVIFVDPHRHTYLLVHRGQRYDYYLTMRDGFIEVVKEGKDSEAVAELTPCRKRDLLYAAKVYKSSTLMRTDHAAEVMENILQGKEQLLPSALLSTADKLSFKDRMVVKANTVKLSAICEKLDLPYGKCTKLLAKLGYKPDGKFWQWQKGEAEDVAELLEFHLK